jgi:hypothetical protein
MVRQLLENKTAKKCYRSEKAAQIMTVMFPTESLSFLRILSGTDNR